jgi:glycosyltransferase involved in cell wall biosynthesis
MPKVSVIIPTYNSEKFLDRTIKSVINQTYTDWELILVDDCSKDKTPEIIKDWERKDQRIKGILLDKNSGGPAHPKNVGIQRAKGELIAFLDHDDEWLPEKLYEQISFLEDSDKNYGLVTCNCLIMLAGEKYHYITPVYNNEEQLRALLSGNFVHSCSSIIVRKEALKHVGNYDEFFKTSDDWDLYLRLLQEGYHIGVVSKNLFVLHSQSNSAGKIIAFKGADELEYLIKKHKGLFINQGVYAKKLVSLSLLYFFIGKFKIGRMYAKKSFDSSHGYLPLLLILISFLNSRMVFRILFYMKKRMSSNVLERDMHLFDLLG